MKTKFLTGLRAMVAVLGFWLLPGALAEERITSFESRIVINPDASLSVAETIQVQVENQQIRHGIYRDFPQLYRGRWGLAAKTGFVVVSVSRDGKPEPFRQERRANGTRVYVGDANALVPTGAHTYRLEYRTTRQLGFFKEHDELYWNVTGNGWVFPIDQVSAEVVLPSGAKILQQTAYTGCSGAKGKEWTASVAPNNNPCFKTTRRLGAYEGLTVMVGWPKGLIQAEDPNSWVRLAKDNPGIFLALAGLILVLVYYSLVWIAVGKDPAAGVIIPLYGPPKGFSPAAVRTLVKMGYDNKAFAANLISLASKGALSIEKQGNLYTLHRKTLKPGQSLTPDERSMFVGLLERQAALQLTNVYHQTIGNARKALKTSLVMMMEKTYFVRNLKYWVTGLLFSLVPMIVSLFTGNSGPEAGGGALFLLVWLSVWTIGVTALLSQVFNLWSSRQWGQALFLSLFSIPFVAGECFALGMLATLAGPWGMGVFIAGALMNGIFYHLLKAPTMAGRIILDQIEGFKMYLGVAEKDRLNLENPPERTPEIFEKFLPYALALDVEQQWAEQFEDVLAKAGQAGQEYSPSWGTGSGWHNLTATSFASSMGSSFASTISSASTAPGSRSGGSGGGGGGGSSGGGGGGGGGGGW